MRQSLRRLPLLRAVRRFYYENNGLRVLPPKVALFRFRAERAARKYDDDWSLYSASTRGSVAQILALSRGCRNVVELGTATGWMSASFALADKKRRVTTYDPIVVPKRRMYWELAGKDAASRIRSVQELGSAGPVDGDLVDFVFIDSSHEREATVEEFQVWAPVVAPGGKIAFHDYGGGAYPGVEQAIHDDLELVGDHVADIFVWKFGVAPHGVREDGPAGVTRLCRCRP